MEIAKKVHTSIWNDISTARVCMQYDDVITSPIKFLRVYKTVGVFLPNTFRTTGVLALARIFDDRRDARTASLKTFANLAYEINPYNWRESIQQEILSLHHEIEPLRNKVLAHKDITAGTVSIQAKRLKELVQRADEIFNKISQVIWEPDRWVTEIPSTVSDVKAFEKLLKSWDYPKREP